jgi:murein DD-endopeptidase MepM/ murein hydrolase activator NlpD
MNFDKSKVVSGKVYPTPEPIIFSGVIKFITEGVTCFQDIAPYNSLGYGSPIPYAYKGHGGVDFRAAVGTPIYANRDINIKAVGGSATGTLGY